MKNSDNVAVRCYQILAASLAHRHGPENLRLKSHNELLRHFRWVGVPWNVQHLFKPQLLACIVSIGVRVVGARGGGGEGGASADVGGSRLVGQGFRLGVLTVYGCFAGWGWTVGVGGMPTRAHVVWGMPSRALATGAPYPQARRDAVCILTPAGPQSGCSPAVSRPHTHQASCQRPPPPPMPLTNPLVGGMLWMASTFASGAWDVWVTPHHTTPHHTTQMDIDIGQASNLVWW